VKLYPTTLVSGTFPEDEGNPIIRFPDRENNDRDDQGYLGLVMDDVSIMTDSDEGMEGAVLVNTAESDPTEYRAVNLDDSETRSCFGGDGIEISGDKYERDTDETSIDGRAIVVVDRTAAESVARTLDVNGDTFAGMDETTGNVNGGLIEYSLSDSEGNNIDVDGNEVGFDSRYARNPELREGLYGTEVGVMVTRRSEADSGATGYTGDSQEPVVGEGEDGGTHSNPDRATFEELVASEKRRDMMWYTAFNMETGEKLEPVSAEDDAGSEPLGYSFLEARFDPSVGRLPENDWAFVQDYIESGAPDDEEIIMDNIEDNMDSLSDDPNTERMVGLIQNQVTAE